MARKKKQRKSIIVRLLVIGLSVYMILELKNLYTGLIAKEKELADMQQQVVAEEAKVNDLKSLLEDGSEATLIERAARERLDYGYPYETYYIAQQ